MTQSISELLRKLQSSIQDACAEVIAKEEARTKGYQLRDFSLREAGEILNISDTTLRALMRENAIPAGARHPSGRRAFSIDEIQRIRSILGKRDPARHDSLKQHREAGICTTLSVANFKGGVGKSTTSVHLAQYLALRGWRVCLVDLDPQGSSTSLFGLLPNIDFDENDTILPWMLRRSPDRADEFRPSDMTYCCKRTHWGENLYLIPGNNDLSQIEAQLPAMQARMDDFLFFTVLNEGLDTIRGNFDVIILDFPPSLSFTAMSAIYASDIALNPLPPQMLDFASAGTFFGNLATITEFQAEYDVGYNRLRETLILPTICPAITDVDYDNADEKKKATQAQLMLATITKSCKDHITTNVILQSEALKDSSKHLKSIYEMDPGAWQVARQTVRRAIENMNAVCGEVEGYIKRTSDQLLAEKLAAEQTAANLMSTQGA